MKIKTGWDILKNKPGLWGYEETKFRYNIFKNDGAITYTCSLKISKNDVSGAAAKDFYDNFKPSIDDGTFPTVMAPRDDDGLPLTHLEDVSMTNYFSSANDNTGVSDGSNALEFNMTTSDASKSVDISFSETVKVMDAIIHQADAPLGSQFDIEIIHPVIGKVGGFGLKCSLLGSSTFHLTPTKKGKLEVGLILRVTVRNSSTQQNFQVAAMVKVDRKITA